MRITKVLVRSKLNKLVYRLYEKYCNEPFFPEGEVIATYFQGNPKCLGHDGRYNKVKLTFKPDKFVLGIHEITIKCRD